ncbi:MAG TPA: hypothetical protein VE338_04210 [Ktedonobacterales bacterium]|nr:hypothetical protein [Ktedonobacterales bacterium]
MGKQKKATSVAISATPVPQDVAIRLLYIQQRLDALERLYNEEVSSLRKDVSDMNIEFVRQAQAQGRLDVSMPLQTPEDRGEDDAS